MPVRGVANLLKISEKLEQLADRIEETTHVEARRNTAETWTAIAQLRDAGRYVYSAAKHLEMHDEKYGYLEKEERDPDERLGSKASHHAPGE